MRALVVSAVLLLLSLLPLPVLGQEATSGVATDAKADVRTEAQGTAIPGGGASDAYSSLDLTSLTITETVTDLTFAIGVADFKPAEQETAVDGYSFVTEFSHNGRLFRLTSDQAAPALGLGWFTTLDMRDSAEAEWTQLWVEFEGPGPADPATDTVSVTLDRNLLADKDGAMPFPGRALEGLVVHSSSFLSDRTIFGGGIPDQKSPLKVRDDMPDAGQPAARYDIAVGLAQTGHARLASDVPFRASNGEATTFLFNATARNLADTEDTFAFAAVGAPDRLAVTVPVTFAAIPPGGSVSIPVLVTVPFAHIHGGVDDFVLEMRSESDPGSVGRVGMGIRYLEVPQPAGHHDSVYLHSSNRADAVGLVFPFGYMNTLEDDAADTGQDLPSPSQSFNLNNVTHSWYFPLEPGLQMGLDVDLSRIGRLAVPMGASVTPQVASSVDASVYVGPAQFAFEQEPVEVARMAATAPVDLLPGSTHLFEGDLVPLPAGDRLPFDPTLNLYLEVRLTTLTPSVLLTERPFVAPGGHFTLPLIEYHDPVDEALRLLDGPGLSPLGAQERLVNPGEAVVFPFSIANPAAEGRAYHVEVSGANGGWANLPSNHITVPAHGTATGSLVVRAPAGAADGDRADLIVQAYDTEQPTSRGLLRLLAEVDTAQDHVDDTAAAADLEATRDSPAPSAIAALACLAVAAVAAGVRRRKA